MSGELTVVTGVAGFVGASVARTLVASGRRVRGVVRASSPRANLADFPGELAEADLRDAVAVAKSMHGATELFHVAADYRVWAPDPEEIVRNNVAMTEVVMRAALAAGAARVVYTSSVATLLPLDGGAADETRPARPEQATGAYKRSKVLAERLVERMVSEQGLPAVIVNPSTPIGPRDVHPTPTGRIIVEAANGGMPAYVDSGLNLVHVDDVAAGHLLAAEPLHPVETATTLRIRNGQLSMVDGPFAETKEQLAGFYLLEANDLNEAIRLAAKIPPVQHGSVEVRPVRELDVAGFQSFTPPQGDVHDVR